MCVEVWHSDKPHQHHLQRPINARYRLCGRGPRAHPEGSREEDQNGQKTESSGGRVKKARAFSATGPNAGVWLNTKSNGRKTFLTNAETTLAIRLRLGLLQRITCKSYVYVGPRWPRTITTYLTTPSSKAR
jgi:hypothetical protein